MQANLYFKEGSSDKVYHATIEKKGSGYVVNFAFGRRGSTLQTGTKTNTPVSLDEATKVFNKLVDSKLAKGYRHAEGTLEGISVAEDLPDTPTEIQCVLLNPIEEDEAQDLLKDDDWGVQPKFDGVRFMLKKESGKISAVNRKGKATSIPKCIEKAFESVEVDFFVDGELIGETYYIFDVLEFDGVCHRKNPLQDRVSLLDSIEIDSDHVVFVDITIGTRNKKRLFASLKDEGKEGIVFKKLSAHYPVGRPASGGNYLKHKFYATCSCIVSEVNQKRSVAISLHDDTAIGNVTIPANFDIPKAGDVIEVRYLYAYRGGSLYQPIYLGKRSDIDPEECVVSQLKFKEE